MLCLFHFPDGGGSMFVHGLDLLGPAGDNPHVIGTGMEKKVRNLMLPVSAEEPFGYFFYTPSLFFLFFILFLFYIFFYNI